MTRLTFGFVASKRSAETTASVDALARWLGTSAELDLAGRPSSTYEELVASLREGSSDVAWLPPVVYAWLAEAVTPIGAIVRGGKTTYSAALVVRADSELRAVTDLKGVRAGWVDPWSAAGFVVPRIELARAGIVPSSAFRSEAFHGSHRETLLALGRDDCDVVGTYARTPEGGGPADQGAWSEIDGLRVRVLATFAAIPSDVIAVRRNLAPREHELVSRAFREAFADPEGRKLARAIFDGDELREGLERGHDVLRRSYEVAVANGLFDDMPRRVT